MAKIKRGDRVRIPSDERIYSVGHVDEDQGYLQLEVPGKVTWMPISRCTKVEPCNP